MIADKFLCLRLQHNKRSSQDNRTRTDQGGSRVREHGKISVLAAGALALAGLIFNTGSASAETKTVRLAKQFGIGYLPLTIMEEKKLLEAQGKKLGLDLATEWV